MDINKFQPENLKTVARNTSGPMVWNLLPDHLRDPSLSIGFFRPALKTFIFTMHRDT